MSSQSGETDQCPAVATHGNPFRYCGSCDWREQPKAADPDQTFIGSIALMDALYNTYVEHIGIVEAEGPDGPYMWCGCGWRSDDFSNVTPVAYAIHLSNAQHGAAVKALQPRVVRKPRSEPARVEQTILATDPERPGNCLSACVASYFGVPLGHVPHFIEEDADATTDGSEGGTGWWFMLLGFMAGQGLWPVTLANPNDGEPGEVLFVAGPSPRGVFHQVLYRDGVLWHDPHPSKGGITEVREVLAWRPTIHDHTPSEVVSSPERGI